MSFNKHSVKLDAYKIYVLPIMEYASFVWLPHTVVNINKLESVQRRAMRFVMSNYNRYSSVSDLLSMLHMSTLEGR